MSVYDLLTEEDKKLIISYVNEFGPLSSSTTRPDYDDIQRILAEWNGEKSYILQKLFG